MTGSRERIVLGVMARAPVPGRCKTRLAATLGHERAAEVYAAMLEDTLMAFTGLAGVRTVLLAAPEDDGPRALAELAPQGWEVVEQRGEGLGDRLGSAVVDLGEVGRPVVLVDSDSPTKPMAPIVAALGRFQPGRSVLIGPCDDGGYYLIGLGEPETRIFDDIPWSTSRVLSTTRLRCQQLGVTVTELPTSYDVDEAGDLERLRRELSLHPERAPSTARALGLSPLTRAGT